MSGITGLLYRHSRPVEAAEIRAMNRMQSRSETECGQEFVRDSIGLGQFPHPSDSQSASSTDRGEAADSRYRIAFCGRIYNAAELGKELKALGQRINSNSESDIVLAAYREWGARCQLRFNGFWALAIWDSAENQLFLSRDRFGLKSLYYISGEEGFAFASEMKAFLPLSWFTPAFDNENATTALGSRTPLEASDRCLLRGVKRLQPGHFVTLHPDPNRAPPVGGTR